MDFEIKLAMDQDIINCCRTAVDESVRTEPENWPVWAKYCMQSGPAYSGWYRGSLIGCAGVHIVRPGVANGWLVLSDALEGSPPVGCVRALIVAIKDILLSLKEICELRTIRTFCLKGNAQAERLIYILGFRRLRKETETRFYYRWAG